MSKAGLHSLTQHLAMERVQIRSVLDPTLVSPDSWLLAQARMGRPGDKDIQYAYHADYATHFDRYKEPHNDAGIFVRTFHTPMHMAIDEHLMARIAVNWLASFGASPGVYRTPRGPAGASGNALPEEGLQLVMDCLVPTVGRDYSSRAQLLAAP
jgi:hypothetical protein